MAWREQANFGFASCTEGLVLPAYTVATLPSTGIVSGQIVYCSDGNAGEETLVRYDGTNWVSLASGATAATS